MNETSVGAFAVTAVLGYAVVFIGLILLMLAIFVMGRVMRSHKAAQPAAQPAAPAPASALPAAAPAPGSAGELKLYDTDDRTAAILMAIVADELQTPLNELRFKSIREVKSDEV